MKNFTKNFVSISKTLKYTQVFRYRQPVLTQITRLFTSPIDQNTKRATHEIQYPTPVLGEPYYGIGALKFDDKIASILLAPINPQDVEITPDGALYLPEIKYRRILNSAFGPGGWALLPRGPHIYNPDRSLVTAEYALYCQGRFVSQAWGEQEQFGFRSIATALEGAKSNALMRCCKDIGIANELWDPNFIIQWKAEYAIQIWCEHLQGKGKRRLWRRKDREPFSYPWKEGVSAPSESNRQSSSKQKTVESVEQTSTKSEEEFGESDPAFMFAPDLNFEAIDEAGKSEPNKFAETKKDTKYQKQGFDIEGIISFGKYKGIPWKEFLQRSDAESYLRFLVKKIEIPSLKQTAAQALAYLKNK